MFYSPVLPAALQAPPCSLGVCELVRKSAKVPFLTTSKLRTHCPYSTLGCGAGTPRTHFCLNSGPLLGSADREQPQEIGWLEEVRGFVNQGRQGTVFRVKELRGREQEERMGHMGCRVRGAVRGMSGQEGKAGGGEGRGAGAVIAWFQRKKHGYALRARGRFCSVPRRCGMAAQAGPVLQSSRNKVQHAWNFKFSHSHLKKIRPGMN